MILLIETLDVWLLVAAARFVQWCVEWLSLRQRTLERGMIVAYGFLITVRIVQEHASAAWHFCNAVVVLSMVLMHLRSDSIRLRAILLHQDTGVRVFLACFVVLLLPFLLWPPAVWLAVAHWIIYAAFGYVVALPVIGTPGRRRRKALADLANDLKDRFGRPLVPAASGGAA